MSHGRWDSVKIWSETSTAYILGGGPSLLTMDLTPIHDKHVIGVNNAYRLGDWVDVCWFGDYEWYGLHRLELFKFYGLKVHCCNIDAERPGIKELGRGKPWGIDKRRDYVAWNDNSGASAINLAYHLGVRTVVLLGFDMKFGENRKNNWHEDHKLPPHKDWNPYPKFLRNFPIIKQEADKLGLTILNATPDSALDVFPMVKLEETL